MNPQSLRTIYAVSELAETLRGLIEDAMPRVWVEGEISNLSQPASGHWYFTIKDERAQIRCAMFRNANRLVRPPPQNGDRVLLRASVSYYVARGDLQLICEHMEPAGEGALLQAFEALKRQLAAEGLFDGDRKRSVPRIPRRIGLITSATGAAVHDVQTAIARRFPLAELVFHPVPVQGSTAAPAIVEALSAFEAQPRVDVLLLVRGGGSLEDLWPFNEERVARAVAACSIPVVTGIGHETDTTICDFVADLRAATPTAAAELVTPDRQDYLRALQLAETALQRYAIAVQRELGQSLEHFSRRLAIQHPRRSIRERAQRLDDLTMRIDQSRSRLHSDLRQRLASLESRLRVQSPRAALNQCEHALSDLSRRLRVARAQRFQALRERLSHHTELLEALGPAAVMKRGYSIAQRDTGEVLRSPSELAPGDAFNLILADGQLRARRDE